jgi:hypothetical protein
MSPRGDIAKRRNVAQRGLLVEPLTSYLALIARTVAGKYVPPVAPRPESVLSPGRNDCFDTIRDVTWSLTAVLRSSSEP